VSRERGLLLQIRAARETLAGFASTGLLVDVCSDDSEFDSESIASKTPVVTAVSSCVPIGARQLLPPADACPIAQLARERGEELRRQKQTLRELEEALASAPRLVQ
jgi:hypothetical protein